MLETSDTRARRAAPSEDIHFRRSDEHIRRARHLSYCIHLSLVTGIFLLCVKSYAYHITGSLAVLSDVAESVVHFFILCFAAYSVWLAQKPADRNHLYGHDRINFFSVGFEGAMIIIAALFIFYEAGGRWRTGDLALREVGAGIGYIGVAAIINTMLGVFLLREGRRRQALILEANGRHVLADGLTSAGVVMGLTLSHFTNWQAADPIVAILIGLHILWSGAGLIRRSVGGLMDSADPKTDAKLRHLLDEQTQKHQAHYHFLRHRDSGGKLVIDFHLLLDNETTIARAHDISMEIESEIARHFEVPTEITTHFEPLRGHDEAHQIRPRKR